MSSSYKMMEGVILVVLATTVASSCILNGLTIANDFFDPASTTPTTTTSTVDTGSRGNYYMYFAGAAYCPSAADWSCQFCQQTGPNVQLVQFFSGPANNATRAFIARNDNAQELIVAWRGSVTAQNFYVNFVDGSLVYPYNDGIGVHEGNWNYLLSLYDPVTATLKEQLIAHPTYRVVFVGHSLGSILATYHIFKIKHDSTVPSFPISLYSYGGRRAGNVAFANWFNSQSFSVQRYTANRDVFPHLPQPSTGYVHFNTEIWIKSPSLFQTQWTETTCSRTVYEDPNCSASEKPCYSPPDHLRYYDVDVTACGVESFVGNLVDLVNLILNPPSG